MLIAIEGVDGAGKHTLSTALTQAWERAGADVLRLSFPRYGESIHADLAAEALRGEHGDLATSAYAMAALWALDRHEAGAELCRLVNRHDIVLLDRYVASNAAYTAARLAEDASGPAVAWIAELEFGRLALPHPDVQLLLQTPLELAASRASSRAAADPTRARDAYERDTGLQQRAAAVYAGLAAASWASPWQVLTGTDPDTLAATLRPPAGPEPQEQRGNDPKCELPQQEVTR